MNERHVIESINQHPLYRVEVGSRPCEITVKQLRAGYLVGKLLIHAHKRGKRRNVQWVTPKQSKPAWSDWQI